MSQLPINYVARTHKEFLKENYEKSQKKQIFYLKSKYDNFMTLQDYFTRECAFRSFDVILFEKKISWYPETFAGLEYSTKLCNDFFQSFF